MGGDAIITTTDARSDISVTDTRSVIAVTLLAAEIFLDPDTLNRFFLDQFSLSENAVLGFSKTAATDVLTFVDTPSSEFGLAKSNSFSFTDSPQVSLIFNRTFTDAFSLDDITAVDAVIKDTLADKTNVFVFSDAQSFGVGKSLVDAFTIVDAVDSIQISKEFGNSFNVSEVFSRIVAYNRTFADALGLNDAVDGLVVAKALSDAQTMTETHIASTSLGKTDSYSLTDAPVQSFDKAPADSLSLSQSLSRAVVYNRTFTDAFSLDDAATVDAVVKDHQNAKTNVFSFADAQSFGFSKAVADTFSFADDEDIDYSKGLSDSVSVTENLSLALLRNAAINVATLNSRPLNE